MNKNPIALVIDDQWGKLDNPMIGETYGKLPVSWRRATAQAPSGGYSVDAALAAIAKESPDLVLLDLHFGEDNERLGLDILTALREVQPSLPILMFTSLDPVGYRELVVRSLELGANEYLDKQTSVRRMQEVLSIYTDPRSDYAIYGNSAKIRRLRAETARVAFGGESSVLIVGESGSGKELVARAVHRQGPRARKPFIVDSCAHSDLTFHALELFGQERAATGSTLGRDGLLSEAHGGVLFLDEIADLELELQAQLARLLETRTFRRIGGGREHVSNFQIICTTHEDPEELIASGRLREDFYYRISAVTLEVPPLRERRDDVPVLIDRFLKSFLASWGATYPGRYFEADAVRALASAAWPGNARELRNVVERALIRSRQPGINVSDLFESTGVRPREKKPDIAARSPREPMLPDETSAWPRERLKAELVLALEARRRIEAYKGPLWKAEFMRSMYPECRSASSKGFSDLMRRLTQGPWGKSDWRGDKEIADLVQELQA